MYRPETMEQCRAALEKMVALPDNRKFIDHMILVMHRVGVKIPPADEAMKLWYDLSPKKGRESVEGFASDGEMTFLGMMRTQAGFLAQIALVNERM